MPHRFPLRVVVMDDDFYALKGVASLLARDLRTMVVGECNTPEHLLKELRKLRREPDIIMIDAEYDDDHMSLKEVIGKVKKRSPEALIICWSQYGGAEHVHPAIDAGADAVFVKNDVQLAIATNVVRAFLERRAYTPSVAAILEGSHDDWMADASKLDTWEIHPDLSPRLKQVFWLCIVYGMSVRAAADEMYVQPETVERYRMKIYDILEDGWLSETYLREVWNNRRGDEENPRNLEWAFHLITQPRADKSGSDSE